MRIKERYASAVSSSNLKSRPETTMSDTDVLSAYAVADQRLSHGKDHYTKHPLAVPLERLFTGDSSAGTQIQQILADMIRGRAIATRIHLTRTQRMDMARAILGWFRNPTCKKCDGHGFMPIPMSRAIGPVRCKPCDSTGRIQIEHLFREEQREIVRWAVLRVELEAGMAGPAAMKALAPSLNFI